MKLHAQHWKTHLLSAEGISPIPVTLTCMEKPRLEGDGHCLLSSNAPYTWIHGFLSWGRDTGHGKAGSSVLHSSWRSAPHSTTWALLPSPRCRGMQAAPRQVTSPWAISAWHGHTVFESSSHHFFLCVEQVLERQEMGLRHPTPSLNE